MLPFPIRIVDFGLGHYRPDFGINQAAFGGLLPWEMENQLSERFCH
jgi:hypothetical protein